MINPKFTVSRITTREDGLGEVTLRLADSTIDELAKAYPDIGYNCTMTGLIILPKDMVAVLPGQTLAFVPVEGR